MTATVTADPSHPRAVTAVTSVTASTSIRSVAASGHHSAGGHELANGEHGRRSTTHHRQVGTAT